MNKLYYPTLTHLIHDRDGQPTYFGESRTGLLDRLDQSSHHLPTSASTRPSLHESTRGRKKVGSTAAVIITRLLAVLVVAMVVTSILGFTLFGRQEGTSATALVSLAIGGAAAVLGLIFGFREAHQARDSSRSCHGSYVPAGLCPTSTYVQHALPVVLTQPPIDLHRKKDEVLCLATAAAPSYERDISKEQIS